jgi:hypothetical protein
VILTEERSIGLQEAGAATLDQLVNAIFEAQADGSLGPGDPRQMALAAWSAVHGLAMLAIDNQLPALGVDDVTDAVIDSVVRVTRVGLRA